MPKMPKFKKGDLVRFKKKALVFNKSDFTEFEVIEGTEAEVASDHDIGPISACIIKLKKDDGNVVIGETDSQHLIKVKK